MKKYFITSIYLDRCIKTIEQHCFMNPNSSFHGEALSAFCSKPKNLYALHLLAASGEIRMDISDRSEIPSVVWLENKGMLHSYTKWQKIKSAILGFIAGVFSTTVIPYLFQLLVNTLSP